MQEKDFNQTYVGIAYNYFSYFRMLKNVLKATNLSQAAVSASLYLATPIAKKTGNDNVVKYTQYGAMGVSVVLNPLVTIPMLAVNYVGDTLLDYKWSCMTEEQKESFWGKEIHAAMMVTKQEIAFKAGEFANQYYKSTPESTPQKGEQTKTNASPEEKTQSASNNPAPEEKAQSTPNTNTVPTRGQQYDAETIKQVDDLTKHGYKAQVPKTKNGQVVKGKYEHISPQRAKELLAIGETVEFKNSHVKGGNHKIWVTRNNPYKADPTNTKVDSLAKHGYKPQVQKTDKHGNVIPHKYTKVTAVEAKELLNQGRTVEFKHWYKDKANRKIWLSKEKPANQETSSNTGEKAAKNNRLPVFNYPQQPAEKVDRGASSKNSQQPARRQSENTNGNAGRSSMLVNLLRTSNRIARQTVLQQQNAQQQFVPEDALHQENVQQQPMHDGALQQQQIAQTARVQEQDVQQELEVMQQQLPQQQVQESQQQRLRSRRLLAESSSSSSSESESESESDSEDYTFYLTENNTQDDPSLRTAVSDNDVAPSHIDTLPQIPQFPKLLHELGCTSKKLSPQKVAHSLWLANGKLSKTDYQVFKTQFSFWAKQNQPALETEVNEIIAATYHMK